MHRCSNGRQIPVCGIFSIYKKIPHCRAYKSGESNPVPTSGSASKANQFVHVPTSKSMHAFFSNPANRQTDKRTQANAFTSSFLGVN